MFGHRGRAHVFEERFGDVRYVGFALRQPGGDMALLFDSLYTAIDHNLLVLAANGIRTVFDLAIE